LLFMTASGRRAVPLRRLPRRSISRLSVKASQGAVMSAPDSIGLKPESLPLEGSRDTGDGILISIYPDVCLTPVGGVMVAIPYTIFAYQSDDANTAATVRQTSLRSHTSASLITHCYGDEAGTGGGVISGTHNGVCEPKTWSPTVRFEGHGAVRHQDEWWMNKRNTIGKLTYIKDQNQYKPPKVELRTVPPTPTDKPVQLAQAANVATDAPMFGKAPPSPSTTSPSTGMLGTAGRALGGPSVDIANFLTGGRVAREQVNYEINYLQSILDAPSTPALTIAQQQVVQNAIADIKANDLAAGNVEAAREKKQKAIDDIGALAGAGVRTTADTRAKTECPCIVEPYEIARIQCPEVCPGTQAHHIVPDMYLGMGNRAARIAGDRIPTPAGSAPFPSYQDGPAICLLGGASTSGTQHNTAHQADATICAAGANSATPGTLPVGYVMTESTSSAIAARPDCAGLIETAVTTAFNGVDPNALCRAKMMPIKPGSPAYDILNPTSPKLDPKL
jgi:hypothetical protein